MMLSHSQVARTLRPPWQSLQNDFQNGADAYPDLRHVIVQALDKDGTLPPGLEKVIKAAGGASVGEMRERLVCDEKYVRQVFSMDIPPKIGYLYGSQAARRSFERLAERAWPALPGSRKASNSIFPKSGRLSAGWTSSIASWKT